MRYLLLVTVIASVLFSGCTKDSKSTLQASLLPTEKQSTHFSEVAKHLDFGGTVYSYVDIDGDAQKMAEMANDMLPQIKELPRGVAHRLDFVKIFEAIGISNVAAIGLSSYKNGDLFRNQGFVLHTGERKGIMKQFAKKPRKFDVFDMAPADSDMVFDMDLNIKSVIDMGADIMDIIAPAEKDEMVEDMLGPLKHLPLNWDNILKTIDTRMMGVLRVNDKKMIRIPGEEVIFPHVEFVIELDNVGFFLNILAGLLKDEDEIEFQTFADKNVMRLRETLPGDLSVYDFVLINTKPGGHFYLASSMAYFEYCTSTKQSVKDTEAFKKASMDISLEGNGISYTSPHFYASLRAMSNGFKHNREEEIRVMSQMLSLFLPQTDAGTVSAWKNLDNGTLFSSNSHWSHKATLISAAVVNPFTIGILTFATIAELADELNLSSSSMAVPVEPHPAVPIGPLMQQDMDESGR